MKRRLRCTLLHRHFTHSAMVSTPLALLALAASVLAAPAPVPAPVGGICATCPMNVTNPAALDAEGKPTVYWLVNRSNSGQGTPTYCGYVFMLYVWHEYCMLMAHPRYNVDKSHPWYQVFCFYANNGVRRVLDYPRFNGADALV